MDEWIYRNSKILYSLKKERNSDNASIQMNLEDMLNEISLSQKDNYSVIPLIRDTYSIQIHTATK